MTFQKNAHHLNETFNTVCRLFSQAAKETNIHFL